MRKRGKNRRFLAMLLSLAMTVTMLPVASYPEELTESSAAEEVVPPGAEEAESASEADAAGQLLSNDQTTENTTYYEVSFAMANGYESWIAPEEEAAESESLPGEAETNEAESIPGEEEKNESESLPGDEEPVEEESEEESAEAEEEEYRFTLPDPMLLPEGTLINAIDGPYQAGYVFLGWYYDADLAERVGSRDKLTRNLTL